jgi:hypothetical protein
MVVCKIALVVQSESGDIGKVFREEYEDHGIILSKFYKDYLECSCPMHGKSYPSLLLRHDSA